MIKSLLNLENGNRTMIEGASETVYAFIWFDEGIVKDDFGRQVPKSGEWEIVFFDSPDWIKGKELSRKYFRYAEPKMRNVVAVNAVEWIKEKFRSF